ncbi:hypothetical protein R6Z02_14815 [Carnobacterium maltaromaticum]|uniref:hypothetical protein n=1 Tax=Carnobacterium maltaromaticum TaxID=2751 RepID=UPI00298B651C|nr:hypothetical protein [Carnobacterium maltaromaticum]MDW5525026.1 hypothetical protein [Carnobacterium maltaromaticum]
MIAKWIENFFTISMVLRIIGGVVSIYGFYYSNYLISVKKMPPTEKREKLNYSIIIMAVGLAVLIMSFIVSQ